MRKTISTYLLTLLPFLANAQPGTVDTTFHSGLSASGGWIQAVVNLPDDRLLIGGTFSQYDGAPCGRIARLLPDGALDPSFAGGIGFDGSVFTITRQHDGQFLVGGSFHHYQGMAVPMAVRLSADGELDTSFQPELADLQGVSKLIEQPDGRILAMGQRMFGTFVGLRRLMPDGSLDTSFTADLNKPPSALSLLNDGRILVGASTQSQPMYALHRLLPNGALDPSFTRGVFGAVGASWASVEVIHVQADGAYVVGGHFSSYAGSLRKSLARILPDGSLDQGFDPVGSAWPGPGIAWANVNTILGSDDGSLMVAKFGLNTRLHADGSMDPDFHRGMGILQNNDPLSAAMIGATRRSDGRIILFGSFITYDGLDIRGIVRLNDCSVGSACDDGDPQTINDTINGQCVCAGTPPPCTEDLVLALTLDAFGSQTTWTLQDDQLQVVASGGPYADGVAGSTILEELCVPQGCYHLEVHDAAGNGITAGGYVLTDGLGRRVVDATGAFSETSEVLGANGTVPQAFCLPLGDARMLPGLCDKPGRSIALPVYASSYTGATQYQFWIFDPHGTYSRKVALTAPQFVPGNLATLPVPTGVDLNICVRPLVNGAYRPFGGVCKYRFTPHAVGSTATSLLDAPSITLFPNPNHTRTVNLAISGVDTEGQLIQVELFDAIGQRAFGGSFPATAETFQQTLPLNSELPAGLYLLNITIDGRRSTHRLVLE